MLLNLLNSQNYISVNIDAINIFGLNTAVYCSELLNIYKKATLKNKLIDEKFFKVDRKYIFSRTSLTVEDQIKCDLNLSKVNIISIKEEDRDIISFDYELYASILSSEDLKLLEDVSKKAKIKTPRGVAESKRQHAITELKNNIICSNYELLTALRGWVDSIFSRPNGYLSLKVVKLFQDTLNNYTKGDLDLALRLVEISTIQGYKDCNWAIQLYEKDLKMKAKNEALSRQRLPRVTEIKKATSDDLSDEEF